MYTFNRPKQLYSSSLYIRVDKELLWSRSMSLGALRLLTLVLLNAAQFLFSVYFNLQLYLDRTYDACSNQVKSVCEAEMRTWRLKTGKEEKKAQNNQRPKDSLSWVPDFISIHREQGLATPSAVVSGAVWGVRAALCHPVAEIRNINVTNDLSIEFFYNMLL